MLPVPFHFLLVLLESLFDRHLSTLCPLGILAPPVLATLPLELMCVRRCKHHLFWPLLLSIAVTPSRRHPVLFQRSLTSLGNFASLADAGYFQLRVSASSSPLLGSAFHITCSLSFHRLSNSRANHWHMSLLLSQYILDTSVASFILDGDLWEKEPYTLMSHRQEILMKPRYQ